MSERLVREIAEIEIVIHSLANDGAPDPKIQHYLNLMAFKTRELLYPNYSDYPLLTTQ